MWVVTLVEDVVTITGEHVQRMMKANFFHPLQLGNRLKLSMKPQNLEGQPHNKTIDCKCFMHR